MHSLENTNFMFYSSDNGSTNIQVILDDKNETVWVSQNSMAEIFEASKQTISYHLGNIYKEGELNKFSTVKEILTVQEEGGREVQRNIEFYNLDAIISVGYRVSSQKATMFRIWANSVLKNYLVKGFAIDDDRLKQGKNLFDKDYFDELIEIVREIRASERRFYQKITDLYATSCLILPASSNKSYSLNFKKESSLLAHSDIVIVTPLFACNSAKSKYILTKVFNSLISSF